MNDIVGQSACVRPEQPTVILGKNASTWVSHSILGWPLCYSSLAFIGLTNTFDVAGKA